MKTKFASQIIILFTFGFPEDQFEHQVQRDGLPSLQRLCPLPGKSLESLDLSDMSKKSSFV